MEPWGLRQWHADFLSACNRHDPTLIREFIAPGVRRAHLPAGADAWLEELMELFAAFPDWQWRRILTIAEDDRMAVHLRGSGTHTGPYRSIASTRRRVNIAEFQFLRVEGGRITEVSGSDDAVMLAQLSGH